MKCHADRTNYEHEAAERRLAYGIGEETEGDGNQPLDHCPTNSVR